MASSANPGQIEIYCSCVLCLYLICRSGIVDWPHALNEVVLTSSVLSVHNLHNFHCTTVPVDSVSFPVLVAVLLSPGFGFTFSTTNIAKLEVETRLEMGLVICYGGLPSGKNKQILG